MFKKQVKETEIAGDNVRRMVRIVALLQTFAENQFDLSFMSNIDYLDPILLLICLAHII